MSGGHPSGALREIGTLFRNGTLGSLTDRQLLGRFTNRDDASAEDAFATLLERHGPMVWGVCCRMLPDRYAAADAFQATFLVLVRKAPGVKVDESLGPWLHGVSRRVAARSRATSMRTKMREVGGVDLVTTPAADPSEREQFAILDEEIAGLPENQRTAIILCDLQDLPHEEAARRLGCPVGTVESRLSRGRQRLRDRLVRRGLAPTVAAGCATVAREASAAIPSTLFEQSLPLVTTRSAAVASLAEGVIRMMSLARFKWLAAVAVALILTTAGVAVQGRQQQPENPAHTVSVATVQAKAVTVTQQYVCQIKSHHHIEVRSPETGFLEEIAVREGQTVKRGDLLFQIKPITSKDRPNAGNEGRPVAIRAPFDGIVSRMLLQRDSLVQTGDALTNLFDNSVMWIYFDVPESRYLEFVAAKSDQKKANMKFELLLVNGEKFKEPGKLGSIGADFTNGTVAFRADFPNPSGLLRHGQTGNLLVSEVLNNAITIPQRATFEMNNNRYVYVVDKDSIAHRREVTIQGELDGLFIVKSGIHAGERLVVDELKLVRDGQKVEYNEQSVKGDTNQK